LTSEQRLRAAAFQGDLQSVKELLDSGCDINAQESPDGPTALLVAIENLQEHVIRLLLERGANPNQAGHVGITPLQAAIDSTVEAAKQLSDRGGRVVRAETTIISLLLASAADLQQVDRAGKSAVDWARHTGHAEAHILIRTFAKCAP
jgi:ankyrin repeat protein